MARKKHEEHENHERWLVSYADFITLLFAFFVVMFASSQADAKKVAAVSESIRQAYQGEPSKPGVISRVLGRTADPAPKKNPGDFTQVPKQSQSPTVPPESPALPPPPPSIEDTFGALKLDLAKEIGEEKIHLAVDKRGLIISLEAAAFFPSGADRIAPEMYPTIEKIAAAIGKMDNPLRLEGHTDSMPVRAGRRFPTNWHLSAARAVAMLDLFASRYGVAANRLAVVGYADTKPVATNDTPEGRARNRRVDIVVVSDAEKEAVRAANPRPAAPRAAEAAPFWKRWLHL